MFTAMPSESVNQIYPSCVPWPRNLCPTQLSPSSVQQSTTAFSTNIKTSTPLTTFSYTTTTIMNSMVSAKSPTIHLTPTTTTSSASITTTNGISVTSDPPEPDQAPSNSNISSEGIIYSLIGSVIVLALFIVLLAIFLTVRLHRRCQHSKTPKNDPRQRSENHYYYFYVCLYFTSLR